MIRGPIISSSRRSSVIFEISRISSNSSFNSVNENSSKVSAKSSNLSFFFCYIKNKIVYF